jgi:hypothetical protein
VIESSGRSKTRRENSSAQKFCEKASDADVSTVKGGKYAAKNLSRSATGCASPALKRYLGDDDRFERLKVLGEPTHTGDFIEYIERYVELEVDF